MKNYLILSYLLLLPSAIYSQTLDAHINMLTCFSQGHSGSGATNCASVSVIKLAISKYGLKGAFLKVDTLPEKYIVHLRNGHQAELTLAELATMENLNRFYYTSESDTVKVAKFMYAVMTKNKQQQNTALYPDLTAAGSEQGGWFLHRYTIYQLITDTYENLKLLGLDTLKIKEIKAAEVQNYPDIIITSSKHSAYASLGSYDEYGEPKLVPEFERRHHRLNVQKNYILLD